MSQAPTNAQIFKYLDTEAPIELIMNEYAMIAKKQSTLSAIQRHMVNLKVAKLVKQGILKVDNNGNR